MPILQAIFAWSQTLPAWQGDAISRLLAKASLTAEDHDDLYALLKAAHGISDPKNRQPKPLTAGQIPELTNAVTHVELRAIKNLCNVNAIAERQRIGVSNSGITVIYGDNGSGKSGYSRVLKRACRARDQSETIYPNANLHGIKAGSAEASFEISVDGEFKEVVWQDGRVSPSELSSFFIFDSRCARAYLDNEDDFSYVPYGLDVFEGLANTCRQLKAYIDAEYKQTNVDIAAFAHLQGDTAVGKLIAALSFKTESAKIEALATLTPEELEQKEALEKSLKENNPKEKATQLRLLARRVDVIAQTASDKALAVSEGVVTNLKLLVDNDHTAQAAAALAATQFKESEKLLPGTGGDAWRELFNVAKKFALEAYPDKQFPDLGVESLCPLCQQPLSEGTARLLRFGEFIQAEAEKTAQARRQALHDEYRRFIALDMSLKLDDVTYAEIETSDIHLASDSKKFEAALLARHEAIKGAVSSRDWSKVGQPLISPVTRLQALSAKLRTDAEIFEKASAAESRAIIQHRYTELSDRVKLGQVKDSLIAAVRKLEHQEKLKKCLLAVKTKNISDKASELSEQFVSKELEDALNREFKSLGVGNLSVSLQSRADRGKRLHKLVLQMPQVCRPSDILSEGEQRAIAIGSFLAEVGLSGGKGGIVFDDPVSSLDHRRRERVARRFAEEAAHRQVIVLTHDIYFLCLLVEEAKQANIEILTQSLTRCPTGFGVADPELPFEGKNTGKRIRALKAQQQDIAKLYKEREDRKYQRETMDAYFHLRLAWERAVEEILFGGVVLRFRKGIETQRLRDVSVEDSDFTQVSAGMSKCSNYAHDKAPIGGTAVPEPSELLQDICELENWCTQVQQRSAATNKRRKAGPTSVVIVAPSV